MDRTRVKLTICGSDYTVVSDDSESYVRTVGDKVNNKMNGILSKNPKLSISMAAVLSALEYCDESLKAAEKTENFRSQIKEYVSEISKYRDKNSEAECEINNLKDKIELLTKSIDKYKKEIYALKSKDEINQKDAFNQNEIVTLSLEENEIADDI